MTITAAEAALKRLESDQTLITELEPLKDDPAAVLARIKAEGFEFTPEEMRDAVLERFGGVLTPEQLDSIAAGIDESAAIIGGSIAGGVLLGGAWAVFAVAVAA